MKIPFKCSLSIVLILIFSISFLSLVRTAELHHTRPAEEQNKFEDSEDSEFGESSVKSHVPPAEIHSSFSEETVHVKEVPPSHSNTNGKSVLKNIDVSPELSETSNDAVVFTLIDTAAELKNRAKVPFDDDAQNGTNNIFRHNEELYIVRAEPKTQAQSNVAESEAKVVNESIADLKSSQEEFSKTAPQHEDIPSFREWTQKQLAEAERKKFGQNSTTERITRSSGKFRIKNYASPDCGAKIVAANPESVSSASVLSSSKDEYMLNYCTNRIWFVVELCEAIQAKQLDLANFELFSSSPKDFVVSVSHRFPTRDWSIVGKFTARDSRDIQTFNLNSHLFGRYIKVELLSHYGKEQFCPVSWIGVFGTSEFEVLAKEDERHSTDDADDDDEDLVIGQRRDTPKNLFISATDAVLSIVKKATAPFMKSENNETGRANQEESENTNTSNHCVTPRYIIVCDNCSQSLYDEVYSILSCRQPSLAMLISCSFIRRTLINNESCGKYGLDFNSLRSGAPFPSNRMKEPKKEMNYLTALLKNAFIGALCNFLAVSENKVVVNGTEDVLHSLKNLTDKNSPCNTGESHESAETHNCLEDCKGTDSTSVTPPPKTEYSEIFFLTEVLKPSEQFSEKIEPTKTLNKEEIERLPPSDASVEFDVEESKSAISTPVSMGKVSPTVSVAHTRLDTPEATETLEHKDETKVIDKKPQDVPKDDESMEHDGTNTTSQDSVLDSILSDIKEYEKAVNSNPSTSILPRVNNLPTESIFLRLANRIKNLEINMSLSSTYLEELSRRYRNQLEMLSKTINITAQKIEERYRLEEERERLREKEIMLLRIQLANLTRDMTSLLRERNSWSPRASSISQHIVLVSVELFLLWVVFFWWKRTKETKDNGSVNELAKKKMKRRKSLEGVTGHNVPLRRARRPSDEAMEIALSRNRNIGSLKFEKKRKRKKKDSKSSISMIHAKRKKSDSYITPIERTISTSHLTETITYVSPELDTASTSVAVTTEPVRVIETANRFAPISTSPTAKYSNYIDEKTISTDPPHFIKTAMSSRNSRQKIIIPEKESSQELYRKLNSVEPPPREKKTSGASLKKYMKKFFDK